VAPRLELPLRLEWWQVDPAGGRLRTLEPDLRPTSLGYYDYTAAEWFDVPRRTGLRHVVGPYVDVHGTGRYLLTLTEPVVVDGEFVGVVGADVPVRRFETHLLQVLGRLPDPFVLVNGEDRVVLSTAPRCLVGELLTPGPARAVDIAGTPWRLLRVEDGSVLSA
jgi:methyl-accepting chemotaxis protein-like sensor